jgi:hypothetical protein
MSYMGYYFYPEAMDSIDEQADDEEKRRQPPKLLRILSRLFTRRR